MKKNIRIKKTLGKTSVEKQRKKREQGSEKKVSHRRKKYPPPYPEVKHAKSARCIRSQPQRLPPARIGSQELANSPSKDGYSSSNSSLIV